MTGQNEQLRDNYPQDFDKELTGTEATLFMHSIKRHPEPMMQLTICRRQFLLDHNLRCVYGLRGQDREFSPRALYWAKRVIPLHEPFYLYRKRSGSIVMSTGMGKKLDDQVVINKSLLAFHASVCKQPDFDKRLTVCWGRGWITWMFFWWFSPDHLKKISRADRLKTLELLFSDGFDDFKALLKGASLPRRIAGWWMRTFVRHPSMRFAAESFFRLYFYCCR